jgi:hypothetical protein
VVVVAAVAALATLLFHSTLLFGGSLHGYDWQSHHFHYFDWVRISMTRYHTLPLYMSDAWVTRNFLANAESPTLGPLVALLFFLPTGAYIKLLIAVFSAAGLVGMYFLLSDLEVSAPVAALAAMVFAFNGFFVSHLGVGHHWVMGGYLLPGLLCLFRRAALGSRRALLWAAAIDAFTILGGQHQPFIWQNLVLVLFALLWALRVRSLFPLGRLALLLAVTAGLAAVKLLPMLAQFAAWDPAARIQGLPPRVVFSTLVGGAQHPGLALPQVVYEYDSGWWEYAFYLGPVALACFAAGVVAARRAWPMIAIGAFFLVLSVEWPESLGPIHLWSWLQDLPVWRTQRCPSRFLFVAVFALSLAGAVGLQRAWAWCHRLRPRTAWLAATALAAWVAADLYLESRPWQRAALGDPIVSGTHRPRPLATQRPPGTRVALREFAPNRLVVGVSSVGGGRVVLNLEQPEGRGGWRVEGLPALSHRGKFLALEIPPGERDIVMTYAPRYFRAGAAVSAATLLGLALSGLWTRRRGRSPDCAEVP